MTHNALRALDTSKVRARSGWFKLGLTSAALCLAGCSGTSSDEATAFEPPTAAAYQPVAAYAAALNAHSFDNAADFAMEDWNDIGPTGVWSRGRSATVATLNQLEQGILKDVTFSVERVAIYYASSDVALITITSLAANYTPDEARERATFVVVQQNGKWLLFNTQVTTITGDDNAGSAASVYEGSAPSDVGGSVESAEVRTKQAHAGVVWFNGLPVTHDFDSAPDFTTGDWNVVAASGYWTQDRAASLTGVESAYTTFLNGTIFTEDELVARLVTDDVSVLTEARSFVEADEQNHQIATFVLVNHQDRWLVANTHVTSVQNP